MINLTSAVEAILFAAGDSVPIARLSLILGVDEHDIECAAAELQEYYSANSRGMRILRLEDKLQMCSAPEYAAYITKALEQRKPPVLSQPALETLAVVAYFQPVTRAYVDQVRGVDSSYTVSMLQDRGLIEECGRLEVPGRPAVFRTTDVFLRTMGISSMMELPPLPEVSAGEGMDKLKEALNTVHGGFAYLIMTEDAMIGALDPNGFRPLSLGKMKNGAYVLASETCALDVVGAELVRNIRPGEIVVIDDHGYKIVQYTNQTQLAICSMEFIYFARPDSDIYGVNVHSARKRMGARLAQESPVDADMVIGVPNSSLSAASGYAEEAGLPNEMGLIKNQYVARTFIQPTQELREQGVRMKLSAVRGVVKGKRVIVIDDSIVRGTTSKRIVQLLKEAGAAEVHMRISSPPLKYPCFYGIDISTTKELIAAKKSVEEIRDFIGADSLAFLSLDGLVESIGLGADAPYGGLCVAYFNGDYPTALDDYESDFLKSLTPEDRVRLPEFALYKSKYEGNEYTTTSSQEEH